MLVRKAVSPIMAVMMLIGITLVGGVLLSNVSSQLFDTSQGTPKYTVTKIDFQKDLGGACYINTKLYNSGSADIKKTEIVLNRGELVSCKIVSSVTNVVITDNMGLGTGATATATVVGGVITSIDVASGNGGTGYEPIITTGNTIEKFSRTDSPESITFDGQDPNCICNLFKIDDTVSVNISGEAPSGSSFKTTYPVKIHEVAKP